MRALQVLVTAAVFGVSMLGGPVEAASARSGYDRASVRVRCGPHQRAVVRYQMVAAERATIVQCVGGRAYEQPRTSTRPVVYRASPYRQRLRSAPSREFRRSHVRRSWAKTALIIGGSAGTGAGIGGLVGGKKGALIGAAIGGGAASLYEGAHRR